MLHHELKKLRSIADALKPERDKEKIAPLQEIDALCSGIGPECDRITDKLTEALLSEVKEKVLERFIRYHQTGLIELANQLQSYLAEYPQDRVDLPAIAGYFISRLFDLLNYIERYFSRYFDVDEKIPDAYTSLAGKELSGALSRLLLSVKEKLSSPELKACIMDYLHIFTQDAYPPNMTFRDMVYLKGFLAELNDTFQRKDAQEWDLQVSLNLIYLNFNHLGFLVYWQERIRNELDHTGTQEQYRQLLTRFLTLVKNQQFKPSFSYNPCWPDIRTMLQGWINDELASVIKAMPSERKVSAALEEKILMNLPVAQIALLIRLLHEEGCFANTSVTDILRLTARFYSSKRQENISPGSLGKEYYSVNQVTAAVMRDMLQKMTNRINKNYFPV